MNEKVNRKVLKASGIVAIVMVGALLVVGALELVVLGMKSRLDYLGCRICNSAVVSISI